MAIDKPLTRKLFKFVDGKPKALRYAFGFSQKYEECELELAKTGSPAVVGKQMMKANDNLKVAWGMIKVEGKTLTVEETKRLTGIEVKLAKALKKAKLDGFTIRKGTIKELPDGAEEGREKPKAAAE
ncbi:MAG: hypothetical protein AAGC57_04020 [Pseudomonadota bacterium]